MDVTLLTVNGQKNVEQQASVIEEFEMAAKRAIIMQFSLTKMH